jgi:hypothetical protein
MVKEEEARSAKDKPLGLVWTDMRDGLKYSSPSLPLTGYVYADFPFSLSLASPQEATT